MFHQTDSEVIANRAEAARTFLACDKTERAEFGEDALKAWARSMDLNLKVPDPDTPVSTEMLEEYANRVLHYADALRVDEPRVPNNWPTSNRRLLLEAKRALESLSVVAGGRLDVDRIRVGFELEVEISVRSRIDVRAREGYPWDMVAYELAQQHRTSSRSIPKMSGLRRTRAEHRVRALEVFLSPVWMTSGEKHPLHVGLQEIFGG